MVVMIIDNDKYTSTRALQLKIYSFNPVFR